MTRFSGALVGTILGLSLPAFAIAQDPPQPPPLPPVVRDVHVNGTHDISNEALLRAARVRVGEPLPVPVDRIDDLADRVRHYYRDEGYSFARVHVTFDPSSAALSFDVDEGVIDGVEFTGVSDRLKRAFAEDF
ncbi:MAG TPA: POTRA domain-containing protein, partial [Vicinamibacterales bacterium]